MDRRNHSNDDHLCYPKDKGVLETCKNYWRPLAAVVYLLICIFDFVAMPIIINNDRPTTLEIIQMSNDNTTMAQLIYENEKWTPITTEAGGILHISFGTILTGAAVTRGLEKKQYIESKERIKKDDDTPRRNKVDNPDD